jgi:glycosyltransferase involved in cell wall biosynthesis
MKTKLEWICPEITPYWDDFFESLVESPSIDLHVHVLEKSLEKHPWSTNLGGSYNFSVHDRLVGGDERVLRKALTATDRFFVVAGWNRPTQFVLLNLLSIQNKPFAVWTDTPNVVRNRAFLKRHIRARWLRWLFRRASWIMGTGEPALDALQSMGASAHKVVNFPYVFDIDKYNPDTSQTESSETVFLSAGKLDNDHKGFDIAIRALAKVRNRRGLKGVRYLIAGTGPDEENLRELTDRLDLNDVVEFAGWLEPDEMIAFYQRGDVFVHPSYFEPYGVVVVEAMASGLPIIASDECNAALDRVDEQSGWIHESGDVDALARCMQEAMESDALDEMGKAARREAESWTLQDAVEIIETKASEALATT